MKIQKVSPEHIYQLGPDEVLVFTVNSRYYLDTSVEYQAKHEFGALDGVTSGPSGQCYALPFNLSDEEYIMPYMRQLADYVHRHPELFFYVYVSTDKFNLGMLFRDLMFLDNVSLPKNVILDMDDPQMQLVNVTQGTWNWGKADDSDDEIDEEEAKEERREESYQKLKDAAFDVAVHHSCGCDQLAYDLIERHAELVDDIYGSDPYYTETMVQSFVNDMDYTDPVLGYSKSFCDWADIFSEDSGFVKELFDKCAELKRKNEELTEKLKRIKSALDIEQNKQ